MQKKIKYCVLAGWSPANGDASPSLHGTQATLAGVATNLIREATEAGTRLPKFYVGGKNLDFIICWLFLKQRAKLNTCSSFKENVVPAKTVPSSSDLSLKRSVWRPPPGACGGRPWKAALPAKVQGDQHLPASWGASSGSWKARGAGAPPVCSGARGLATSVCSISAGAAARREAAPSSSPRHCAKL